ncbi:TPA: ead/Ea22-like family protein [Citrobacter braakii]
MTALNKQALRKLAKALSGKEWVAFVHKASGTYAVGSLGHDRGEDIIKWPGLDGQDNAESKAKFIAAANPATVLALLDELEAAEKRIAELEASHSKLRDTMATIHNTIRMDGGYTPLAAILNAAKRAHEESATAAGIGVKEE